MNILGRLTRLAPAALLALAVAAPANVHAAVDALDIATVSMTNPTTPKLSAGKLCYSDGRDLACDGAPASLSTSSTLNVTGLTINGVAVNAGGGALSALTDVSITTPVNNSVLTYDGMLSKWKSVSVNTALSTTTILSNWPDALQCGAIGSGGGTQLLLRGASDNSDGYMTYYGVNGVSNNLNFNMSNQTYSYYNGSIMNNCLNKSIPTLYAEGRAFNFIGSNLSSAASPNMGLQYSNNGIQAADARLTYNSTTNVLSTGTISASSLLINGVPVSAGGSADRITSGTTSVIAIGSTSTISATGRLDLSNSTTSKSVIIGPGAGGTGLSQVAYGEEAGGSNPSNYTTMIGALAGRNNTGVFNTGIGYGALLNNTGPQATSVGGYAGQNNTASYLTSMGYQAAQNNTAGYTTAIGMYTGKFNSGVFLTALGNHAAEYNKGWYNTALGVYSLQYTTSSANNNVAVGYSAGLGVSNTSTFANSTLIGAFAGQALTSGGSNTLVGYNAGGGITSGANNIVIGAGLSPFSNTGNNQLNIGNGIFGDLGLASTLQAKIGINVTSPTTALEVSGTISATAITINGVALSAGGGGADRITSGTISVIASSNTGVVTVSGRLAVTEPSTSSIFIGNSAGAFNQSSNILAIGSGAASSNTGFANNFIGAASGANNSGMLVTAVGNSAANANTGSYAVGLGGLALANNTGNNVTGIGYGSLQNNSGAFAQSFGYVAGQYNTGAFLTALGASAAWKNTANFVTAVGYSAVSNVSNTFSNVTGLGYNAQPTQSNQVMLGDTNIQSVSTSGVYYGSGVNVSGPVSATDLGLSGDSNGSAITMKSWQNDLNLYAEKPDGIEGNNLNFYRKWNSFTALDPGIPMGRIASYGSNGTEYTEGSGIMFMTGSDTAGANFSSTIDFLVRNKWWSYPAATARLTDKGLRLIGGVPSSLDASTTLDVAGAIRMANTTDSCDTNRLGSIRYNAGAFQVCRSTVTGWEAMMGASGSADRITSGTTSVVAIGATNTVSITGRLEIESSSQSSTLAIGLYAGLSSTGNYNTFIGRAAGQSSSGDYIVAIGRNALYYNTAGSSVGIGTQAGYRNTGSGMLAIGNDAGYNNTASAATLVGSSAGYNNGGSFITAIGNTAAEYNKGLWNTAIGYGSLQYTASGGNNNVAIGYQAAVGVSNTSTYTNSVMVGSRAGRSITSGANSTLVGANAGTSLTTGINNTALGAYSGQSLTTGGSNTLIGYNAGGGITTGINNIVIGSNLSPFSNTGNNQLNIGNGIFGDLGLASTLQAEIGINVTSPTTALEVSGTISATAIRINGVALSAGGGSADRITSGTTAMIANSTTSVISLSTVSTTWGYLGSSVSYLPLLTSTGVSATNVTASQIVLSGVPGSAGSTTTVSADNLGNHTATMSLNMASNTIINAGKIAIGTSSAGTYGLYVTGDAYSTGTFSTSDARFKENIHGMTGLLQAVDKLRPVTFTWKPGSMPARSISGTQIGLIAQEVEKIYPELVKTNTDGYKAVAYDKLGVLLLGAVKDLKAENDSLKAETADLRTQLESLRRDVEALRQAVPAKR